jgi:hypothetical protein
MKQKYMSAPYSSLHFKTKTHPKGKLTKASQSVAYIIGDKTAIGDELHNAHGQNS